MSIDTPHLRQMFLDSLPAGEWSDVRIVKNPGGMMASKNLAIFANATWLREGGKAAFLKFILPASEGARSETNQLASKDSLHKLGERLRKIQTYAAANEIPLVPILKVGLLDRFEGLLIAMERVTPLNDLIKHIRVGIPTAELAVGLLRSLSPLAGVASHSLHFDICPKNIGILSGKQHVFLDPDSFYLEEDGSFKINLVAWKPHRIPARLKVDILRELENHQMHLSRATAVRMQCFGLALVAAECTLKPILPTQTNDIDSWLDQWPKRANPPLDRLIDFWHTILTSAVERTIPLDLSEVANELQSLIDEAKTTTEIHAEQEAPRPMVAENPGDNSGSGAPLFVAATSPTGVAGVAPGQWAQKMEALVPTATLLRQDALTTAAIDSYRSELEKIAEEFPARREIWLELILVTVSYQKDAISALRIADNAARTLPEDPEIMRWQQVIKMWSLEKDQ